MVTMGTHDDDSIVISDEDFRPEIQADYKALHDLFVDAFTDRIANAQKGPAILFGGFLTRLGIGMLLAQGMKPRTVARNLALWMSEVWTEQERRGTRN